MYICIYFYSHIVILCVMSLLLQGIVCIVSIMMLLIKFFASISSACIKGIRSHMPLRSGNL